MSINKFKSPIRAARLVVVLVLWFFAVFCLFVVVVDYSFGMAFVCFLLEFFEVMLVVVGG